MTDPQWYPNQRQFVNSQQWQELQNQPQQWQELQNQPLPQPNLVLHLQVFRGADPAATQENLAREFAVFMQRVAAFLAPTDAPPPD